MKIDMEKARQHAEIQMGDDLHDDTETQIEDGLNYAAESTAEKSAISLSEMVKPFQRISDIPPRKIVYRKYIKGYVTGTTAGGGTGKTSVVDVEAVSMALGIDLLHPERKTIRYGPARVIMLSLEDDEMEYARQIRDEFKTEHHEVEIDWTDMHDYLDQLVVTQEFLVVDVFDVIFSPLGVRITCIGGRAGNSQRHTQLVSLSGKRRAAENRREHKHQRYCQEHHFSLFHFTLSFWI